MRFPSRTAALGAAFVAVVGLSCTVPTDKAKDIQVLITLSDTITARGVLRQGERDVVYAKAYRIGPTGDTIDIPNVAYDWSSSNPSILAVENQGGGAAEVTGIASGFADVGAEVVGYEGASGGQAQIRVASSFIIDSIRPLNVRYGQKLTVYGVGIANIFFLEQGFTDLIPDEFSFTGSIVGLAKQDYWVPYPAFSDRPFFFGPGFFGALPDSVFVTPEDIFEPDSSAPTEVDINGTAGPRTIGGLPTIFFNPALFFEPPDTINFSRTDWIRFLRTDTTTALTFLLNSSVFGDTQFTYFSDSIDYSAGSFFPTTAVYSPGYDYYCNGFSQFFFAGGRRASSPIFALKHLSTNRPQMLSFYNSIGRYSLAVVQGYLTVDRRITPDRFEENDIWCHNVDSTFSQSNDSTSPNRKHIVVGYPLFENGGWFDSTLTIDNPGDGDFIKFRVQPNVFSFDTLTRIVTKPLPLDGIDFSDIDVFVLRASDFAFMGSAQNAGSNEALVLKLPADDYYLAIMDVVQQQTRYSICIVKTTANCIPPGTAPPAVLAPSVRNAPSRANRGDPTKPPPGFTSPIWRLLSQHR